MSDGEKLKLAYLILDDVVADCKNLAEKRSNEFAGKIGELEKSADKLMDRLSAKVKNAPFVLNFGKVRKPETELVHSAFETVARILASQKRKEKNIMLVGEAGSGKTQLVSSVAKAMKLPFYPMSVGLQTTKSDLLGFVNATGVYVTSIIREAFENGGVLLLDEFDCAHAGVVTILNSLLANGHASFPDKVVTKHKDFVCICACNTYGRGATAEYIGRNRLDAATLDRFIVVNVNYDRGLENAITQNEKWLETIGKIRANIAKHGIKHVVSPRASMDGADLLDADFDVNEVLELTVFKGVDASIREKMLQGISVSDIAKSKTDKLKGTLKLEAKE